VAKYQRYYTFRQKFFNSFFEIAAVMFVSGCVKDLWAHSLENWGLAPFFLNCPTVLGRRTRWKMAACPQFS